MFLLLAELDWEDYLENYVHGMRKFVLKESDKNLDQGQRKMRKLYIKKQVLEMMGVILVTFFTYASILLSSS